MIRVMASRLARGIGFGAAAATTGGAFGGFGALACVMVLGPRKGKYTENGIKPIPAHSFPLAAIGVFLLMFGWYGFNGGSVLSAEPSALGLVFTTTTLAACAGAIGAIVISWAVLKKPDLSMALNGILAGLVGITANADVVSVADSLVIGFIAGVIVVFSIITLDKAKIDDPVGAISVHGVCGIWGTIAVAIFGEGDFSMATQIQGALLVSIFAFVFSYAVFFALKMTYCQGNTFHIMTIFIHLQSPRKCFVRKQNIILRVKNTRPNHSRDLHSLRIR